MRKKICKSNPIYYKYSVNIPGANLSTIRCFVALPLPAAIKVSLVECQEQMQRACGQSGVRWVGPEQMHLTLRFFGNIEASQISLVAKALAAISASTPPFSLATGFPGCFPETRFPKVIWIGLRGGLMELENLHSKVVRETHGWGDAAQEKSFQPHLTLGRVKTTRTRELGALRTALDRLPPPKSNIWEVQSLEFIQSTLEPNGPRYSCLAKLPLSATQSASREENHRFSNPAKLD